MCTRGVEYGKHEMDTMCMVSTSATSASEQDSGYSAGRKPSKTFTYFQAITVSMRLYRVIVA